MKKVLKSIAGYLLRKFAAESLVKAQELAYSKGKDSPHYKTIIRVSERFGTITKMVADAGEDAVLSEDEKAACLDVWQGIADDIANLITGTTEE